MNLLTLFKRGWLTLGLFLISVSLFAQRGSPDLEKRFQSIENRLETAKSQEIPELSPNQFAKALERYGNATAAFREKKPAKEVLSILERTESTLNDAISHAARVRKKYSSLIENRDAVKARDLARTHGSQHEKAMKAFAKAMEAIESSPDPKSDKYVAIAQDELGKLAIEGLLAGSLKEAEITLKRYRSSGSAEKYKASLSRLEKLRSELRNYNARDAKIATLYDTTASRIGDILGTLLPIPPRPDTLRLNDFTIVVEKYENLGSYNYQTKGFANLGGIGRIKFDCAPKFIWPVYPFWQAVVLQPYTFTIVNTVKDPKTEISFKDATAIDPKAKLGTPIKLDLPDRKGIYLNPQKGIRDLADWLKPKPDGIRVRFQGITTVGITILPYPVVTAGSAYYPTEPAIPEVPIKLKVSGFTLEVDSLLITKNSTEAHGVLVLPNSLTSGALCSPPRLDLGYFPLSQDCEFYVFQPDSLYGPMEVGNTTAALRGKGYVADFRSDVLYAPSGKNVFWKGLWLLAGNTVSQPSDTVISNVGYMKAPYSFPSAEVTSSGLSTVLSYSGNYTYKSFQPIGYTISFPEAKVELKSSKVDNGQLKNGIVSLPTTAVRNGSGNQVEGTYSALTIQDDMDVTGRMNFGDQDILWGDYQHVGNEFHAFGIRRMSRAQVYFAAQYKTPYFPIFGGDFVKPDLINPLSVKLENQFIQGVTIINPDTFSIYSPDVPPGKGPLVFQMIVTQKVNWLNVTTNGVHGGLYSYAEVPTNVRLGPTDSPQYASDKSFNTFFGQFKEYSNEFMRIEFVESASYTSDFEGIVRLKGPAKMDLAFDHMNFTSTAHNAGGLVDLSTPDTLDYWGVAIVQKPGFSSGGLVSVKSGQIVLTAAGLAETRHFSQPFWLTWGEMLSTGDLGRLFFDYNTGGQTFDGFGFSTEAVALSKYEPTTFDNGFLHAGGTAYFPFFGPDYLNIEDWYEPDSVKFVYQQRIVELSDDTGGGFFPTDHNISGKWAGDMGDFDFKIGYSDGDQDGFIGPGNSELFFIDGGDMGSNLTLKSRGTCISIAPDEDSFFGLSAGPVANLTSMHKVWGCICLEGDQIKRATLGAELAQSANVSIAARAGTSVSMIMTMTPSLTHVYMDGEAYISLAASLDVMANGHFSLTIDRENDFLEGEISGQFRVAAGALFTGSSLEANGEANWHFGAGVTGDHYQSIQGALSLNIMGEVSTSLGAGFYMGVNAPKEKAWILMGADPRYKLNMSAMPATLTGVYGFLNIEAGINLYVVSGGFEFYSGLGLFVLDAAQIGDINAKASGIPGSVYLVGNVYGRVHGEILGGLASAGAYFNLQVMGPIPLNSKDR